MNRKINFHSNWGEFKIRTLQNIGWAWILVFMCYSRVWAQGVVQHQPPQYIEAGSEKLLEFEFEAGQAGGFSEATLFYRTNAGNQYRPLSSPISNQRVSFKLQIEDEHSPYVEYYVSAQSAGGLELAYPDVHGGEAPIQIQIIERSGSHLEDGDFIDVALLSPVGGEMIAGDEFIFAAALFHDDEDTEGGDFTLLKNGRDVTGDAEITPYMIKYMPRDGSLKGEQELQIRFEKEGVTYLVSVHRFTLAGNALVTEPGQRAMQAGSGRNRRPEGSVELSARNQQIGGFVNDALDGRLQFSGEHGDLSYSFSGLLTSQESSRLQPQNRLNGQLQYGEWLNFQAGHVFPYMSDLTISGRRVWGISSQINLIDKKLQLQLIHGQLRREIQSLYTPVQFAEQTVNGQAVDTLYTLSLQDGGRGAFRQKITGARMAIGHRDRIQVGFFGLKARDDTTSTHIIRDFNDLMAADLSLANTLRPEDIQSLKKNPQRLQVNGANIRPRDNLVFGSDLSMMFDSQRIRFHTEFAASLLNNDISGGVLTRQRADELGLNLDVSGEDLLSGLSWLIIINENMSHLPFSYSGTEAGNSNINPVFPAAILANRSELFLTYAGQNLQIKYRWIGPGYQSLANRTLLQDVSGITVTDRFRFLQNRLYATVGYENLRNNVTHSQDATLRTQTTRSSISWFPVQENLPNVTLSFRYKTRQNGVDRFNPYVQNDFLNRAVRNFAIANGDTVLVSNPRDNHTMIVGGIISQDFTYFGISHQANFSYNHTKTTDEVFDYGDSENHTISVRLVNRFEGKPFSTRMGWNSSIFESASGFNEAKIHAFSIGGDLYLMDNSLVLNGDLSFARNSFSNTPLVIDDNGTPQTFFDNRFVPGSPQSGFQRSSNTRSVRLSATYDFYSNHELEAFLNYTNLKNRLTTVGSSFVNDRILQVRYRYRF